MFSISTVRLKYYVNIRIFAWQSENKKRKYRANIHATYTIWTDAINFLFFPLIEERFAIAKTIHKINISHRNACSCEINLRLNLYDLFSLNIVRQR